MMVNVLLPIKCVKDVTQDLSIKVLHADHSYSVQFFFLHLATEML